MKPNYKNKIYLIVGLTGFLCLLSSPANFASSEKAAPPPSIPLPIANEPSLSSATELITPSAKTIAIRGPEKPMSYSERSYLPIPPFFYTESRGAEVPLELKEFLKTILIPQEASYFHMDVGLEPQTGMPYDHVRIRLKESLLSEIGNYTAASKLSLLIPYLMKVIQRDPALDNVPLRWHEAKTLLRRNLNTILVFIQRYPEYHGFLLPDTWKPGCR